MRRGALFVFVLSMCVTSSCLTRRVENRVGVFLEQSLDEFISENDDAAFQNLEKAMTNWNDIKETTAVLPPIPRWTSLTNSSPSFTPWRKAEATAKSPKSSFAF